LLLSFPATVFAAESSKKPLTPPDLKNLTFIHYVKPDKPGKPPKEEPEPEGSYKLLGLYISGTVTYHVNVGVPAEVTTEIFKSFEEWDKVTNMELFNNSYGYTNTSGLKHDGQNTISWVRIAPPKIIALTSLWYWDDGNPATLDPIDEFDITFNTFLQWGIDPDGEESTYFLESAFDVRNIATHEVGHVVGLADLYEDKNSDLTMYGYGSTGETIKISLATGDIDGASDIYNTP
jgi:hypothetical protein